MQETTASREFVVQVARSSRPDQQKGHSGHYASRLPFSYTERQYFLFDLQVQAFLQ